MNKIKEINAKTEKEAVAAAEACIQNKFRNHIGQKTIDAWRATGMLNDVTPGTWEETTLVCMLENQRTIQECKDDRP